MSVIGEMAARFPNLKFVVRPHPLEDPETWRDSLQGHAERCGARRRFGHSVAESPRAVSFTVPAPPASKLIF